jgi:hypothetical protein
VGRSRRLAELGKALEGAAHQFCLWPGRLSRPPRQRREPGAQ